MICSTAKAPRGMASRASATTRSSMAFPVETSRRASSVRPSSSSLTSSRASLGASIRVLRYSRRRSTTTTMIAKPSANMSHITHSAPSSAKFKKA